MKQTTCGSFDQINFLPDWYVLAARRRRTRRRQVGLVILMMAGMAGLWHTQARRIERLQAFRTALRSQLTSAQAQVTEMVKLKKMRQDLQRQHRIYTELAHPVTFSQIAGTLATLMPATISLREYQATVEQVPLPVQATPEAPAGKAVALKRKTEPRTRPVVTMVLAGSAPSNVDIANFVGRLSGNDLFQNVKMIHSTEGKIGQAITRDFRIAMEVRLDCLYQRVSNPEVAHVD